MTSQSFKIHALKHRHKPISFNNKTGRVRSRLTADDHSECQRPEQVIKGNRKKNGGLVGINPQLFPIFSQKNVEMEGYGNLAEHGRTNGLAALPPEMSRD